MNNVRRNLLALPLLATTVTSKSLAQSPWPNKPVKIVVTFPAGGVTDVIARTMAEKLSDFIPNSRFIIENRPGASTQIGTDFVAKADNDGYTFLFAATQYFTILSNLRNLSHSLDDFEVVNGVSEFGAFIIVKNSLKVNTLREFVDLVKKDPKKYSYGSAGIGSIAHVYSEQFCQYAGIELLHVPYKGSAELTTALISGEVDMSIIPTDTTLLQSGKITTLASFSNKRHPELPDVPTISEAGIKVNLPWNGWGLMAPKGTDPAIIRTLDIAVQKVLSNPDVISKFYKLSTFPNYIPGNNFRKLISDSQTFYKSLLNKVNLKL